MHQTIEHLYEIYSQNGLVTTDTRLPVAGSLFFALSGESFNGNRFAAEALQKGALAVVADGETGISGSQVIRVESSLITLQQLAAFHRQRCGFRILAITGSNGKTTTKELCREVLATRYRVFATKGNLNNHIGVPLTLLSMPAGIQVGIIEMGANHPGEIAHLSAIVQPDCGLITNIGKAHLEGFGSIEGVARAKGELFAHLMERGRKILLNGGSRFLAGMVPEEYPCLVPYNLPEGIHGRILKNEPFLMLSVSDGGVERTIETRITGVYNLENILAAWAVGREFDIQPNEMADALAHYEPGNNRSQFLQTARNQVILDAYNANPTSMAAALEAFLNRTGKNKMLIMGEMRELGELAEAEHEKILDGLIRMDQPEVYCVGKAFEQPATRLGFRWFPDTESLCRMLRQEAVSGRLILVKGSRANRLEQVIDCL